MPRAVQAQGPNKSCITALAAQPGLVLGAELLASLSAFLLNQSELDGAEQLRLHEIVTSDVRCVALLGPTAGGAVTVMGEAACPRLQERCSWARLWC